MIKKLTGLVMGVALFSVGAIGVQAADHSVWRSDFGRLVITVEADGKVWGSFPKYTGLMVGTYDAATGIIDATWIQPKSDTLCKEIRYGTNYWGLVRFQLAPDGKNLNGVWSYCDAAPGTAGAWNARLGNGSLPTQLTAAPGQVMPMQQIPQQMQLQPQPQPQFQPQPQPQQPAQMPVPVSPQKATEPTDDQLLQSVRVGYGSNADPGAMSYWSADLTCDGVNDVVVGHLNYDNPDGPFYYVMLVSNHENGLNQYYYAFPFDRGDQGSLCGQPKAPEVRFETYTEGETANMFAYPVCTTAIAFDDGMCDSPRLFWTAQPEDGNDNLLLFRN
ncbi:MAG: hypothetical protein ACPGO3_11785 [Magnetospiraceae bacterium]